MPYPIFNFGNVFAHFCDIVFVFYEQVVHLLEERRARISQTGQHGDRRLHEVETVDLILYAHIERRRDGAFLHVSEYVQILIFARVGQFVDEGRIAVEVEDDGFIFGKDRIVIGVGQSVRVHTVRLQLHQVDHVDETDLQIGQVVAQDSRRGERFEGRGIAAAGDNDIGFLSCVVGRPIPNGNALRAVVDRLFHRQPLEAGVLGCYDDVDVVLALDAMVKAGKQAVRIGREIHAHHVRLFVGDVVEESGILVRKAVVVLLPYVGGEDEVQGSDVLSPRQLIANFQPLCVLRGHRVDHADKRLVRSKESVPPGEDIAFQPALAHMLGEVGVHDAAVFGEFVVVGIDLRVKIALGCLERAVKAVRHALVRPENAEVFAFLVEFEYIAYISAEFQHILRAYRTGRGNVDRIFFEVGQAQIAQQLAAVGVRVGTDTAVSLRRERAQFGDQAIIFVKQFFGLIAQKPIFEQLHMFGLFHGDGHLVCAEGVFDLQTVHDFRACPALGRAQHDHRPEGALVALALARFLLDILDLLDALVQRFRHLFVHGHGVVAFHKVGLPAASVEEALYLVVRDARKNRRVVDFVPVQVQDGQNCAVGGGVQKFVGMPSGRERAGFRLAVAYGHRGDEVGVIENRAERMRDGVAEFAALVDGAGRFGRNVAGNAAGERELFAQLFHPFVILPDVGVNLAVRAFEIGVRYEKVSAVAGAGKQDHVEIKLFDHSVEMDIHEILSGNGSPMPDDLLFNMFAGEGFAQERVVQKVELCCGQIVGGAPIGVHLLEIAVGKRLLFRAILRFAHGCITPFYYFFNYYYKRKIRKNKGCLKKNARL